MRTFRALSLQAENFRNGQKASSARRYSMSVSAPSSRNARERQLCAKSGPSSNVAFSTLFENHVADARSYFIGAKF
jgi:hypothetical protein